MIILMGKFWKLVIICKETSISIMKIAPSMMAIIFIILEGIDTSIGLNIGWIIYITAKAPMPKDKAFSRHILPAMLNFLSE